MSILDDAIREHLELKRAHGADATELKKLEDEAFGPPGRPGEGDSFSEAQTEFLAAPATDAAEAAADAKGQPSGRAAPNITDLQEAPEPPKDEPEGEAQAEAEAASAAEEKSDAEEEPAEESAPSAEHQTVPVPRPEGGPDAAGPSTEERHAIASQPTEFFDVEGEIGGGSEQQSPTDDELIDSKLSEPRLAPVEPNTPAEPVDAVESSGPDAEVAGDPLTEDEDDFFSEQRLSDELNQALEAPVTDEHEALPELPSEEHESRPATDEHEVSDHQVAFETDEHEAAPHTDEHEALSEPPSEEHTEVYDFRSERREEHEDEDDFEDEHDEPRTSKGEDVLEDTPDFLEDAPEDDELWFEQKPPKDFDFDD
jgi:hypothetical protein